MLNLLGYKWKNRSGGCHIRHLDFHMPSYMCCGLERNIDVGMGAGPLKEATLRRGLWRRFRPLLPAGTSATATPELAVVLIGVLSLFVGEAQR